MDMTHENIYANLPFETDYEIDYPVVLIPSKNSRRVHIRVLNIGRAKPFVDQNPEVVLDPESPVLIPRKNIRQTTIHLHNAGRGKPFIYVDSGILK